MRTVAVPEPAWPLSLSRPLSLSKGQASELTSSGMPGPNVVDTAPFWM